MAPDDQQSWFEDYLDDDDGFVVDEYDLTATPNDFNVRTIFDFIEAKAVKIPDFQRNYVWDRRRASKLIESLIMGLPVPQLFLYERGRNDFLVIDGQQRLLTIYYFIRGRFPRRDKRAELRSIFDEHGSMPADVIEDDAYFQKFNLLLSDAGGTGKSKFDGLNYETLSDYQIQFNLRPIRNVIVKQNVPSDDDSSVYEIFNRLNTGGVNLTPQEIRSSLYHSAFFQMLGRVNADETWRAIVGKDSPDLHGRDVEFLLRSFALAMEGRTYAPSMTRFLNSFSRKATVFGAEENEYLKTVFHAFLAECNEIPVERFRRNKRFHVALFEAAFVASVEGALHQKETQVRPITAEYLQTLSEDPQFVDATQEGTTKKSNVQMRLNRARELLEE